MTTATHRPHWTENARPVDDAGRLWGRLGYDEWGDLWCPSLRYRDLWTRRFNPRRPTHWFHWLRSRITNELAYLEADQ